MRKFIPIVVVGVVALSAGFFGGTKYQQSHARANMLSAGGSRGQFAAGGNQGLSGVRRGSAGTGFVAGEVLSKDDTSITVKLPTGGSSIVFYSPTTSIEKTASGSWSDVQVGTSVVIRGTSNSDGSYTAQTVQMARVQLRMPGAPVPAPQ